MKTAVRRIVSVGILLILLFAMQRLVMPKYVDDVIEGGFTAEYYREENPHEVLMIGDCELYENFSPITMWKKLWNYKLYSGKCPAAYLAVVLSVRRRTEI